MSYIFAHCYADEINMIAAEVTVEGGKAYLTAQGEGIRSSANCRDEDLDAKEVTAAWANQLSEDEAWTEYGYMPGASLGGVKLVNLTSSHLARKMARRDKRHRRSGRPVVQHDIQKTRFVKNMQRKRPACEATAEGCTPEQMERWAGIS